MRRRTMLLVCAFVALMSPCAIPGVALAATPPSVVIDQTTATGATTEDVQGTVNPGGASTTYHFEYGPGGSGWCSSGGTTGSPATSTSSVQLLASDNSDYDATATLTNLSSGQDYCIRLVASNSAGGSNSDFRLFTAGAPPPPPGPSAVTGSSSDVTSGSAVLHGTVNPGGESTIYQFQFASTSSGFCSTGLGTPHGTTVATLGFTDNSPHAVSSQATGLLPSTGYCYRLVAQNDTDVQAGAKLTFVTAPGALSNGGNQGGPVAGVNGKPTAAAARLTKPGRPRLIVAGGRLILDTGIKVSCPGGFGPCSGSGQVAAKPAVLGKKRLKVGSGRSARVRIGLSAKGARALRKHRKLKVKITVVVKTKAGRVSKTPRTVTLKAPKKHR